MDYFRVRNWTRYQHYKKPNPPWVKIYTSLLDDFDFLSLSETTRLLALKILLLAAKTNNRIPQSPEWLATRFSMAKVDLQPLFDFGLLESHESRVMSIDSAEQRRAEQSISDRDGQKADFRKRSLKDSLPNLLKRVEP